MSGFLEKQLKIIEVETPKKVRVFINCDSIASIEECIDSTNVTIVMTSGERIPYPKNIGDALKEIGWRK